MSNAGVKEPKLKPVVEAAIKDAIKSSVDSEQQVIVHGNYTAGELGDGIRIWKTTFLCDQQSTHKSKLIYIEGVSGYPVWTILAPGEKIAFVLVFSGLPKACRQFDLREIIPQPDGFEIKNIRRNKTDVYHVSFND
ncbi:MAG: hypothetical protein EOO13_15065 [Chitinophagaceae bacterium]|nr:MAG: hypothetical protein EOO13_15065 [Chitinophagaceae bacterium]